MTKYRTLSNIELEGFEQEFISFLVVNGIEPKEWEALKKESPDKMNQVIDQFSEVVFEGVFRKTMYIDFMSKKSIKCFQFLEYEVVLVGLELSKNSPHNFSTEAALSELILNHIDEIEVFHSKKKYHLQREVEMFQMTENGAQVSKGDLFKQISLLL